MKGIIRQNRNYSDGYPAFEIDIYLDYEDEYPIKHGKRISSKLNIGKESFISGIRHKDNLVPWMSPDLIDIHNEKKVQLSEILIKNGYKKNDRIKIKFDKLKNKLTIKK